MLNKKQKEYLRAMSNKIRPVVIIGKDGISDTLCESTDVSLEAHELIKISLLKTAPLDIKEAAIELAAATKSEVVHVIGRTFVLYRRSLNHPQMDLPR